MLELTQEKSFTVHWIYHNVRKTFTVLLLTRTKTTFCIYTDTQYGTYKISRKKLLQFIEFPQKP